MGRLALIPKSLPCKSRSASQPRSCNLQRTAGYYCSAGCFAVKCNRLKWCLLMKVISEAHDHREWTFLGLRMEEKPVKINATSSKQTKQTKPSSLLPPQHAHHSGSGIQGRDFLHRITSPSENTQPHMASTCCYGC